MAPDPSKRGVRFDERGFSVIEDGGVSTGMAWNDVAKIFVVKIDLFSYDEVRLGFGSRHAGRVVETGEDDEGFDPFVEEVLKRYPSIPRDWLTEVAYPPFEENLRILWEGKEKDL